MNLNNTQELQKNKTYALTATALMTAVTCILAPLSVPIGPVPISLTNFVIFLSLYLLNWKKGTLSLLIYLLLGLAGLPVFSGFAGGIAKLAGPTGGYIIGFIPMAIVAGIIIDKFHQRWIQIVAMIIGTAICYAFGTVWFCFQSGYTFSILCSAATSLLCSRSISSKSVRLKRRSSFSVIMLSIQVYFSLHLFLCRNVSF